MPVPLYSMGVRSAHAGGRTSNPAQETGHTSGYADRFPALPASVWRGPPHLQLGSKLDEKLINYLVARRATNGSFCAEWLQHASVDTSGWLIDRNGRPYRLAKTSALVNGCERIGDLVDWVWTSKGVITFRKLTGSTSPLVRFDARLSVCVLPYSTTTRNCCIDRTESRFCDPQLPRFNNTTSGHSVRTRPHWCTQTHARRAPDI